MRYAVVIEKGENNYSAYVPDLPGCVSVGRTLDEVKAQIREAIAFHIEGMREDGLPIPPPASQAEYVECDGIDFEPGGLSTASAMTISRRRKTLYGGASS